MTIGSNDTLLRLGEKLVLFLQGVCALAIGVLALLFFFGVLVNFDLLPGIADRSDFDLLEATPLAYLMLPILLATAVATLFLVFGKMRAIIRSAHEGDPFIAENAQRLIAMAWLLLAHWVLGALIGVVRVYSANVATGTENSVDFSIYDLQGLLLVLVLFILARVFRQGAAMREELEGTV